MPPRHMLKGISEGLNIQSRPKMLCRDPGEEMSLSMSSELYLREKPLHLDPGAMPFFRILLEPSQCKITNHNLATEKIPRCGQLY